MIAANQKFRDPKKIFPDFKSEIKVLERIPNLKNTL